LRERAALGRDYLSRDGTGIMTGDIIACKFEIGDHVEKVSPRCPISGANRRYDASSAWLS
jgi:hypothetical protein